MKNFLAEVLKHKREEIEARKRQHPVDTFQNKIKPGSGSFLKSLAGDGLKIIAEIKPRSPSLGELEGKVDPLCRLNVYDEYAQAVSVLCDQRFFGGSVELLENISESIKLPTLLKDFVISPYQIYEARKAGAEAVLLIVKILSRTELVELNSLVLELGMTPVVEVQTEEELQQAECVQPELLLINNRNLDTLAIDMGTVERLVQRLNYPSRVIAASGIENAEHMLLLRPFASRFLIGSALMSSGDPAGKFREFIEAESRYIDSLGRRSSCPP